jgi:hypothetical protein
LEIVKMTFDPSGLTAYVNGEYVDATKASVSIFDHGFLYGDGVFEGMRVFDGGLFRANLHMDRIERSARTIGLPMPVSKSELLDIIGEVVRRSELQDAHVRPIIARGFGGPGIDPRNCPEPTLIVSAYPFPPFLGADPIKLFNDHNDFDGHTYITRQIAGPSLFADVGRMRRVKLPPARDPGGETTEVTDFAGDTETPPSTMVPAPAYDILSIDYAQQTTATGARHLLVTVRVADLPAIPLNRSWRAYFALGGEVPDKGTRYFVEATTDIDAAGGAPSFFWGTAPRLNSGALSETRRGSADGGSITPGTPGVIQIRLDLAKLAGATPGTLLHGTMGRARAAADNSRLTLDRTRGGSGMTLK